MGDVWSESWRIAVALLAVGGATLLWIYLLPRLSVPSHEEIRPGDTHELAVPIDARFNRLERVMTGLSIFCSFMIFLFASIVIYVIARWGMGYSV
jgi:hypothetical protein